MATRARIGLELKDGSYISSYQHWDGYPGGLGYTLIDHWNNYDTIEEAIQLGNASSWRYMIGEQIDFDDRNNPLHNIQNCYYGRDRGEKDQGPKKHLNGVCLIDEAFNSGEEYLYVYRQTGKKDYLGKECGEWFYMKYDAGFTDIAQMKPVEEDAINEHIEMLQRHLEMMKERKAA
jgi:hypothetical protein